MSTGMVICLGRHRIRLGMLSLLAIGFSVLPFFALNNANALGSCPTLPR
jgi:hypothetical protein